MSSKVKFRNLNYTPIDTEPSSGKRYIPSRDKIRAMAIASHEGGRCRCHFCKVGFSVNYCKFVQIQWLVQDWVCRDCRESHPGLQVVK